MTNANKSADSWVIELGSDFYPQALMDLEKPPQRIYGRGNRELLQRHCLSIVGARRATPYGLAVSEMAARVAAQSDIVVVSGGALGCDCAAGTAALRAGGTTIIVSGCGADRIYPASSTWLFKQALAQNGAVISLELWNTPPSRWVFPKRNKIIAALSAVLVVAEAGARSGTMSTAEAALALERTVLSAPGSIFSPRSQGTNRLLNEGATAICDERDLEMAISLAYGTLRLANQGNKKEVGRVMSALLAGPLRPDELASRLGEDIFTMLRTLTDYEASGIVERLPDGRYSPTQTYYLRHNE